MKKYIIATLIAFSLPLVVFGYTVFNPGQLGTSPSNGAILEANATTSNWISTSTLTSTPFPTQTIGFWGDSITAGAFQTTCCNDAFTDWDSHTIPADVQSITKIGTYNGGIGGDYSQGIANRFLNHPEYWNLPTVIWSGRNDFWEPTVVKASIASMVAKLTQPYIVFGILNADGETIGTSNYNSIVALNSDLAALYPNNFWDARAWFNGICLSGGQYYSTLCTAQDKTDSTNGLTPSSFRNDTIHPNAKGQYVFAIYIAQNIVPKLEAQNHSSTLVNYDKLQTIFQAPPIIGSGTSTAGYFSSLTVNPIRTVNQAVPTSSIATTTGTFAQDSYYQVLTLNGRKSPYGTNGVNYQTTDFAKDTTSYSIPIIKINDSFGSTSLEIRGLLSTLSDTLIGTAAGRNVTTGTANTMIGVGAGQNTTSGTQNVYIGNIAGASNSVTYGNTIIGYAAAPYVNGYYNTIIGDETNIQGNSSYNTIYGQGIGANLTNSSRNLLVGQSAGYLPGVTSLNNFMSLYNIIFGTGMDGWQGIVSTGNIGIASTTPIARLSVVGSPTAGVDAFTVASTSGKQLLTVKANDTVVINSTTTTNGLNVLNSASVTNNIIGRYGSIFGAPDPNNINDLYIISSSTPVAPYGDTNIHLQTGTGAGVIQLGGNADSVSTPRNVLDDGGGNVTITGGETITTGSAYSGQGVCYTSTGELGHQTAAELATLTCNPN